MSLYLLNKAKFLDFLLDIDSPFPDLEATINYNPSSKMCIVSLLNPTSDNREEQIILVKFKIPEDSVCFPRLVKFLEPIEHPYVDFEGNLDVEYFYNIRRSVSDLPWARQLIIALRQVISFEERNSTFQEEENKKSHESL